MQSLAGLQIESVAQADDGLRRARTQRFQQSPQIVVTLRRLHQDDATRIKSKTAEAMSGQTAALARSMMRHHDNDFFLCRRFWEVAVKAGQHRDDETESGRERSLCCRDDFMECAAGKTAVRQVAVECGNTERKPSSRGWRTPRLPRQQKAQFGQGRSAVLTRGYRRKCRRNRHLAALLGME
jgi:hypothetical protein